MESAPKPTINKFGFKNNFRCFVLLLISSANIIKQNYTTRCPAMEESNHV